MEEWNHTLQQMSSSPDDEDQRPVAGAPGVVLPDLPAAQYLLVALQYGRSLQVLADPELGNELEPMSQVGSSCDPNREGSFSIREANL